MDFDLTADTAVLERTPRVLRALLADLGPAWTDATEGPETWSPYVSDAQPVPVYAWPKALYWAAHLVLVAAIVVLCRRSSS